MYSLIFVSIIWGLSFGLIKSHLTSLDPSLVAFLRLLLSFLLFLPFLKIRMIPNQTKIKLIFTGFIQFGIMYAAYIHSYQYLKAYEVALFTILTPIYVSLINDIFHKRFTLPTLLFALLAVLGSMVIILKDNIYNDILLGFILIQISNISFAFGQVTYKKLKKNLKGITDIQIFALLYFGSLIITFPAACLNKDIFNLSLSLPQISIILYLGIIASGLCFFLWNRGITKTNIGNIAILNNLKIPLAILFAVILFQERTDLFRLLLSFSIIGLALYLNHRYQKKKCKNY